MIRLFRIVSRLEGISYILLLFIAVPIKYFLDNEFYVKILGMPHGLLFVAYILLSCAVQIKISLIKKEIKYTWSAKVFCFILLASILPFGTFYVERKYLI